MPTFASIFKKPHILTAHILTAHTLTAHILTAHILTAHILTAHILTAHILTAHILTPLTFSPRSHSHRSHSHRSHSHRSHSHHSHSHPAHTLTPLTMELFLEILKLSIPALVVFATAYYLLKMLLDERQRIDYALLRHDAQKITLPLRLQAYERLTLLCDRAGIVNTMMRLRAPGMKVRDLRATLMLAISQEFDHNTSQQLYVSETLWKIIQFAKNETLTMVTTSGSDLNPDDDAEMLFNRLLEELEQQHPTILQKTIVAIRTEAGQLF